MNTPNPEERQRMVNDALKKSGFIDRHKPDAPTPEQQVLERAKQCASLVNQQIMSVLKAARDMQLPFDEVACQQTLHQLLMEAFHTWSKDDLLFLAVVIQEGIMMEGINDAHKRALL